MKHAIGTRRPRAFAALLAAAALGAAPLSAQQPAPSPLAGRPLTLRDAIAIGLRQGLLTEMARESRDASRWRDRAFNARLLPQLSFGGDAVGLQRGINPIVQPDGSTEFRSQSQNTSALGVTLAQPLPWLGGQLSVQSLVTRVDILGDQNTRSWTTTPFVIGIQQDIFRPRSLVWDQRQQGLTANIAERQYIENREDAAATIASTFFDYHAARVALDNALTNAAVNDTLYTLNKGRFEVGKIGEDQLLQSELALLNARTAVDGARLDRDRTEAALRRQLGLAGNDSVQIVAPSEIPNIEADPEIAVQQALKNASAIDQMELDAVTARRHLTEAKLNNGFGARLGASYGVNQTATVFGLAYQSPLPKQTLALRVQMPFFQWGGGRADIEAARAEEARTSTASRARVLQLEEDARFAALQLTQSQRVLASSAKADTVASKRFEVAKNRYLIGKIGIGDLYIAQNEKNQALQSYVQALRGYWTAYYRLRRVTLYDFAEGRLISDR